MKETDIKDIKEWNYPNFKPQEIACKQVSSKGNCGCGGKIIHNPDGMRKLQLFRDMVGIPFSPNSAYRCEVHNKNVGSNNASMHRTGGAFDIPITNKLTREKIHQNAKLAGFTGFGDYNTFVHIDNGKPRYWDNRK